MIKIGILEDDKLDAAGLVSFLDRYAGEHPDFTYTVDIYERSSLLLENYRCDMDLLFLDIQIPDLLGIDAAKRIREKDNRVMIVFLTMLAKYAIDGYSVDAQDYILKPLQYGAFCAKMDRFIRLLAHRDSSVPVQINTREGSKRIISSQILYFQVTNHDVFIHTATEVYKQWGTLGHFEKLLQNENFARCNSCYLVNLKYVRGIQDNCVDVGGNLLTISKPRRKEFLSILAQYRGGSL